MIFGSSLPKNQIPLDIFEASLRLAIISQNFFYMIYPITYIINYYKMDARWNVNKFYSE